MEEHDQQTVIGVGRPQEVPQEEACLDGHGVVINTCNHPGQMRRPIKALKLALQLGTAAHQTRETPDHLGKGLREDELR
jgi:hypothetical protein